MRSADSVFAGERERIKPRWLELLLTLRWGGGCKDGSLVDCCGDDER